MSAPLMQRLAFRQLPPQLKSVLLALANYARDDGTGARPAMATLAAWTGRSVRRTQLAVQTLRHHGFLTVTRPRARHRPTEYALVLEKLEALPSLRRDPWQLALFPAESGADLLRAQGEASIGAGVREFSTLSTGINRTFRRVQVITSVTRSVNNDPGTEIPVHRARARKTAAR
jgi:hypothetical protein